ncbi:MAG: aminomethyl-transferring glycine dehydrogenase, partial [Thermoprotei archaeon]
MPNSSPSSRKALLSALHIEDINALYADIPEDIRLKRSLDLPGPLPEQEILRLVRERLSGVRTALDMPVFLGGGCWPHYV